MFKTVVRTEPKWWSYKVRFNDSKKINLDVEEQYLSNRKKIPKDVQTSIKQYSAPELDPEDEVERNKILEALKAKMQLKEA